MTAYLHHIQLGAINPASLAPFYERALGMKHHVLGENRHLFASGDRRLLFAPGSSRHLDFAAYAFTASEDLRRVRRQFAAEAIEPSPSPIFGREAFAVRDPDGNVVVVGLADDVVKETVVGPDASALARLQHLVVASTQCEAMVQFYVERLGFSVSDRVYRDTDAAMMTCFLRSSEEHHSFAVFQAAKNALDHHCYETPDWNAIRDWADRFAKLNIPLSWGPGRHGPGNNLFIFINDPDGNWLEFSTELEIVRPDRPVGTWPHAEKTLNLWGRAPLRG